MPIILAVTNDQQLAGEIATKQGNDNPPGH